MEKTGLFALYQSPHQYIYTSAIAVFIFDGYYYVMSKLPGVRDEACIIGAGLTPENIIFSAVLSLMTAVMIIAFFHLYKMRARKRAGFASSSTMGLGFIFGFFTVFCALCTIPVISFFGLAIGLGFFTTYNLIFKIISFILMIASLWLVNRQLAVECERCVT